jgi:hypothetical protein
MNCDAMADKIDYDDEALANFYFSPVKSEYKDADRLKFLIDIAAGSNAKEVFAEPTPYFHGAEIQVHTMVITFLELFQKVKRASAHFTTDDASDAYEHITRQHVRDIMTAYGPHLKDSPTFTFTYTYGDEFHRILSNDALTMKSWK